jgi:hypothetical protein
MYNVMPNIFFAYVYFLKIWEWERGEAGNRFYGPEAKAPFQKGPTNPRINDPLNVPPEFKELE